MPVAERKLLKPLNDFDGQKIPTDSKHNVQPNFNVEAIDQNVAISTSLRARLGGSFIAAAEVFIENR
jgi:hypothetical protein